MKLLLTNESWQKMSYFVDEVKTEVSGLGKVEKNEDGEFVVTDVKIFEQTVSGAHSDIEAVALAKFQVELLRGDENPAEWVLWWHSHAAMGVFFSGRDTDTIEESTDFRYMISLVTNHKHEFDARIDIYDPARMFMGMDVEILPTETDPKIAKLCQKEIKAKITKPAPKVGYKYQGNGYQKKRGKAQPLWNQNVEEEEEEQIKTVAEIMKEDQDKKTNQEWINDLEMYLDEKTILQTELAEAEEYQNKAAIQVIQTELAELVKRGETLGYEN